LDGPAVCIDEVDCDGAERVTMTTENATVARLSSVFYFRIIVVRSI